MTKRKTRAVEEEVVETVEEEVVEEEVTASSKDEAVVEWRGRSRAYTKEIHGNDFKKLANSFADKVGGTIA